MAGQGERRLALLALLASSGHGVETRRLCEVGAAVTESTGAGIMLATGGAVQGSLCASDAIAALVEDLQFDLVEGPCVDACWSDAPVLEPNLASPATPRWPAFSGPALRAGVRAVFGFPLHIGAVRLGALNLYRDRAGDLGDAQHADALVVADLSAQTLLLLQAGAPPGTVATELEANANFNYVVHQASGMVAAQLDVSVIEALVRLRAQAFASDRPLVELARDVVARRVRLEADGGDGRFR